MTCDNTFHKGAFVRLTVVNTLQFSTRIWNILNSSAELSVVIPSYIPHSILFG
jgi:hypothetical protein